MQSMLDAGCGMPRKTNAEHQRQFVAARRAQGLKRVILWARPEDVDALKTIARQPHEILKLHRKVTAEIERELRPKIERKISAWLVGKTRRAMLVQRRAQARRMLAGNNRPPDMIRFVKKPSGVMRNRLKFAGWLYDPVAAVWHLPDDPARWPKTVRLLDELEKYGIERLALPP